MQPEIKKKLESARNIWIATVRPDGRPHLTPVWFVLWDERIVICISEKSVKAANLKQNGSVAAALEDGNSPVICEGPAAPVPAPWPPDVLAAYREKYDWELETDTEYNLLLAITPQKWLKWGD